MTNSTSTRVIAPSTSADAAAPAPHNQDVRNQGIIGNRTGRRLGMRRGIAGLMAAATIAFGGTSLLSAADAQAAGVQAVNHTNIHSTSTWAVQPDTVQVRTGTTRTAL